MGTTRLVIVLIAALALMLFMVIRLKMNASLGLLFAALVMGFGSGVPMPDIVKGLGDGFGNFMNSTGLPIGLGIILGQILYDYGGAHRIAMGLVHSFPRNRVFYALMLAGFIISIPVFFDVTFILLAPLGIAVAEELKVPRYKACIALYTGACLTHTCIPPTPGPLSAASILNVDIGVMIVVGAVIGLIAAFLTLRIMDKVFSGNFWNPATDEAEEIGNQTVTAPLIGDLEKAPSAVVSAIPIMVPVVVLLINTVWGMFGEVPAIVSFCGSKTISMLLGVIAALIIGKGRMSWQKLGESTEASLTGAGVVLMITGTGAAFGQILSLSGMTAAITSGISNIHASGTVMCLIAYLIAMVLRVAQGSATVSCITSVTIIAETVASLGFNPLFICISACAGAISIDHVNDSGFWIVVSRTGLTAKGGLKAITITGFVMSLLLLAQCVILSLFF